MTIRIKEDCIDLIVFNPFTYQKISLRFLEEGLYKYFSKMYPDYFIEEEIEKTSEKKKKK